LLVRDKDSCTERFPSVASCVVQPTLVHLYQTSLILLGPPFFTRKNNHKDTLKNLFRKIIP
jgi:hypothetical protein